MSQSHTVLANFDTTDSIIQHDDYSVTIDRNDKLDALETHPITETLRHELECSLDAVEVKTSASINRSIGRLVIAASPFCSLFFSMFQKIAPTNTIADLCLQATRLKKA